MPIQGFIVIAFLTFLAVFASMLVGSVRRGRELCDELARRLPDAYGAFGRPRPGFFDSPRRNAYMRFVMQRQYEDLPDPALVEAFAALRRAEMRQLGLMLAGFGVLGVAAVSYEFFGAAP